MPLGCICTSMKTTHGHGVSAGIENLHHYRSIMGNTLWNYEYGLEACVRIEAVPICLIDRSCRCSDMRFVQWVYLLDDKPKSVNQH